MVHVTFSPVDFDHCSHLRRWIKNETTTWVEELSREGSEFGIRSCDLFVMQQDDSG